MYIIQYDMLVLIQNLCSLHAKVWNFNARHCCDNYVKPINTRLLEFGLTFQWWKNSKFKAILIDFSNIQKKLYNDYMVQCCIYR